MRDTIYRDDAIRIASGYCHPANIVKELAKLPSAQPERKPGRWYKPKEFSKKSYLRICTACQDVCYFCGEGNYRYCPNCGARMEEESDGGD